MIIHHFEKHWKNQIKIGIPLQIDTIHQAVHFHRLKHNKDVSTKILNDLCRILDCDICDIVRYISSDTDQPL